MPRASTPCYKRHPPRLGRRHPHTPTQMHTWNLSQIACLSPIFTDGQGDRSSYYVPIHRTNQILTQSKNSDNELKQTIFPKKNARLLSESAPRLVGGFQGGHGKANSLLGAVPALCRNAPQIPTSVAPLRSVSIAYLVSPSAMMHIKSH